MLEFYFEKATTLFWSQARTKTKWLMLLAAIRTYGKMSIIKEILPL